MPGRYYDVDEYGNIIDDRVKDLFQPKEEEEERSHSYSENDSYMERSHSSSPRRYRSRDRYSNYSRHEKYDDKPWETPFNPLQLAHCEEIYEDKTDSDHSRHKHRHHKHHHRHHHSNNKESEKKRHFRIPEKKTTPADLKERWGHELYIENVVLNPEPEPPRIIKDYEPPKEKWISKAGGVAIFTSRPTSASSYQGKS